MPLLVGAQNSMYNRWHGHLRWDSPTPTGVVDDLASGAACYDDFWGGNNDGLWYLVNRLYSLYIKVDCKSSKQLKNQLTK